MHGEGERERATRSPPPALLPKLEHLEEQDVITILTHKPMT